MAEQFDTRKLAKLVRGQLGAGAGSIELRPIATGKHNSSYWVETGQGRMVLRLAPSDDTGFLFYERRMMRQEPALHALIRARTRIPLAEVVVYDFNRTQIDRDYMLLRALPGSPLSDFHGLPVAATNTALGQVGHYLRQLHALTAPACLGVDAYGYLGEHHPIQPQPTWLAAFRAMWHALLDDVVACGAYSSEEALALRALFDAHQTAFQHQVESRLLHMDVWGQNILIDPVGNVTGLVDFDRALWGDPEIEFAVLDYCGISEPAFWEGYGSRRDDSTHAQIRRLFYLLYEIQKYMPIAIWRRADPAGAARYKQDSLALAAQLGLR